MQENQSENQENLEQAADAGSDTAATPEARIAELEAQLAEQQAAVYMPRQKARIYAAVPWTI